MFLQSGLRFPDRGEKQFYPLYHVSSIESVELDEADSTQQASPFWRLANNFWVQMLIE
jgi:hypothetical protein